jgi:endonuclease YncB( thermonuclease family)
MTSSTTADFEPMQQSSLTLHTMRKILVLFLPLFCFVHICCQESLTQTKGELKLVVFKIADGDSFEGRAGTVNYRIRLYGIDAPERGMDFYRKSKDRLGELCADGPLLIKLRNKDGFGRWVADAFTASGEHINYRMVEEGLAWHFTKYSNDPKLSELEKQARKEGRGLWSIAHPTPPWQYRKEHRR